MPSPAASNFEPLDEETALRRLVEGTAAETGENFFRSLVRNLAQVLGVKGAWVTEYLPDKYQLSALAFWNAGEWIEDYTYDLPGTPCERVIVEKDLVFFERDLVDLFPVDPDLVPMSMPPDTTGIASGRSPEASPRAGPQQPDPVFGHYARKTGVVLRAGVRR